MGKKNSFRFVTRDEKQLVSQRTLKQHLLPRLGFEAPTEPDHWEAILKSIGSYRDIVHRNTPSLGGSMCRIWNHLSLADAQFTLYCMRWVLMAKDELV